MAIATTAIPMPMPACAPVLSEVFFEGAGVALAGATVGIDAGVVDGAAVVICDVEVVEVVEMDDVDDVLGRDTVAATLAKFVAVVGTADHREGAIAEKVSPVTVPLQLPSPQQFQRCVELLYIVHVHRLVATRVSPCRTGGR